MKTASRGTLRSAPVRAPLQPSCPLGPLAQRNFMKLLSCSFSVSAYSLTLAFSTATRSETQRLQSGTQADAQIASGGQAEGAVYPVPRWTRKYQNPDGPTPAADRTGPQSASR